MRCSILIAAALPLVQGVRIIQSNDDGWAEINLRTMFNVLNAAGHEAVLSGPAENQSGKGTQSMCRMPKLNRLQFQVHLMPHLRLLTLMAAYTTPAPVEAQQQAPTPQTHASTTSTHSLSRPSRRVSQ